MSNATESSENTWHIKRTLVKPLSNAVIVTKLHACFEESIGDEVEGYIKCNLFFLRSLVSEEKVNIKGFSRGINDFFSGKDMVIFLACVTSG